MMTDLAGHEVKTNGTLVIDNTAPAIGTAGIGINPLRAVPQFPASITIAIEDLHLASGTLFYRTTLTGAWTSVLMNRVNTGFTSANYTAQIPALVENTVYWYAALGDAAGNILTVDNGGQPYSYSQPRLRLEEQFEPPTTLDLTGNATLDVRMLIPEDAEYMAYVLIEYVFDDGTGSHVVNMTVTGGNIYNYTFATFPKNATVLNYSVIGVDIYGNQIFFSRTRSINLLPPLPAWEMSAAEQVVVLVVALVVGIVCGVVYSGMVRRRLGSGRLTRELVSQLEREPIGAETAPSGETQKAWSSVVVIVLTFITTLGLIASAAVMLVMFQWPEAAMLFLTGAMLATVFLWILATNSSVTRTLRAGHEKLNKGQVARNMLIGLAIFALLLAILWVGNTVSWWRVRVNQQAYHILGLELPRVLSTLAGTFFSSIILLSWSIGKDVRKTTTEIKEAASQNENPGLLLERREARMAGILGAVGWKGALFVAIIGVTLIFASDLSVYAPQGMLIILPFLLGAVITVAVNSVREKVKKPQESPFFVDHLTKCAACGATTGLGGTFCEQCGARLVAGSAARDGVFCPSCHQPSPGGVKFCRRCGLVLPETPAPSNPLPAESSSPKDS